jgi:acetyltransferase-like isoleucine patch superfamily enzyme
MKNIPSFPLFLYNKSCRKRGEIGNMYLKNHFWRIFNSFQQSTILHSKIRTELLRFFNVKIDKTARLAEGVYLGSNNIVMGKGSFVNINSFLDGNAPITIEEHVRLAPYVKILTGTHDYRNSVIRVPLEDGTVCKSVKIKRGSWIGMNAIIMPGVTVEEGCIVAAGSIVTKDTIPNGLYVGMPAKRVKDLPVTEDLEGELTEYFNAQ